LASFEVSIATLGWEDGRSSGCGGLAIRMLLTAEDGAGSDKSRSMVVRKGFEWGPVETGGLAFSGYGLA
jgi:hypothetical protein